MAISLGIYPTFSDKPISINYNQAANTCFFGANFGTFTMCLERCKKLQRQCVVKGNYQIALTCWHKRIRNSRLMQWIYCKYIWLVVSTPLKNISQMGWLFPIYGNILNVPNHQPDIKPGLLILAPRIKSIQNLQRYQNCKPPNHMRHAHHPTNSSTSNSDIPGRCYTLPWLRFPSRQLLSSTTGFSFQAKPSCWSHWSESCRIHCGCIFHMIIPDLQDHTSPSVWNVPFQVGSVISSTSQHLLKLIETCWNCVWSQGIAKGSSATTPLCATPCLMPSQLGIQKGQLVDGDLAKMLSNPNIFWLPWGYCCFTVRITDSWHLLTGCELVCRLHQSRRPQPACTCGDVTFRLAACRSFSRALSLLPEERSPKRTEKGCTMREVGQICTTYARWQYDYWETQNIDRSRRTKTPNAIMKVHGFLTWPWQPSASAYKHL